MSVTRKIVIAIVIAAAAGFGLAGCGTPIAGTAVIQPGAVATQQTTAPQADYRVVPPTTAPRTPVLAAIVWPNGTAPFDTPVAAHKGFVDQTSSGATALGGGTVVINRMVSVDVPTVGGTQTFVTVADVTLTRQGHSVNLMGAWVMNTTSCFALNDIGWALSPAGTAKNTSAVTASHQATVDQVVAWMK